MYILRIMAPVKPVTIEDILKDMRKKNKKKISQKNNTNKNGTVSAKMVELVESPLKWTIPDISFNIEYKRS